MRKFSYAQYKGTCGVCGKVILPGMPVVFSKVRKIEHENCTTAYIRDKNGKKILLTSIRG